MRYKIILGCFLIISPLIFQSSGFAEQEPSEIRESDIVIAQYDRAGMQIELRISDTGFVYYKEREKSTGDIGLELYTQIYQYSKIAEIIVSSSIQQARNDSDGFIFAKTENKQIEINYTISENSQFHSYLSRISGHISGRNLNSMVWIVDSQLAIFESFPEQYRMEIIVLRGSDLLTVVFEGKITLTVFHVQATKQKIYETNLTFQIASGGTYNVFNFPTFALGVEYRPENLSFELQLDNSVFMIEWVEKQFNEITNNNSSIQTIPSIVSPTIINTTNSRNNTSIPLTNSTLVPTQSSTRLLVSGFFMLSTVFTVFSILTLRRVMKAKNFHNI